MNVDCAACVGNPRSCGDCSIGLLLGPIVTATKAAGPGYDGDVEGYGRDGGSEAEMTHAIALFVASGMLPGLRAVG